MDRIENSPSIFQSFWQAGYECADHLNWLGDRVDLLHTTAHNMLVEKDYKALELFQISTVREGIRWNKVEKKPGFYDWTEVINRIEIAQKSGIQQIWDICHFGFPEDLSPMQPHFADRLAAISRAFAELWSTIGTGPLIITPINEISFLSWLGGEKKGTIPFLEKQGFQVKYELVKAAIASINAIKKVDPNVRIMHTEPLVYIHPWDNSPPHVEIARQANEEQFQTLDMLSGRMCPELGGTHENLDIIGLNFYYNNQWEHQRERIRWEAPRDPRWKPLSILLQEVQNRYNRPIVISETSHLGVGRGEWILEVAEECKKAIECGVDLQGICLYPIIDRPDWDFLDKYHNSGLWDLQISEDNLPERVICQQYADELIKAQEIINTTTPAGIEFKYA